MRAYVRACVRALALRAKRRLNARRIGRPDRYEIATYAEGKGEKDGEDGNNGMNARASCRAKRKPARGAPRAGPMGPSADPGAARSLLENRCGSVGERSQAGFTGKHGYVVIWSRFSIFSFITEPFSCLQIVLIDPFQLINRYFPDKYPNIMYYIVYHL